MTQNTAKPSSVVIAGGGVAALECLMALRDLALMAAREVRGMWIDDARFWLVTPEPRPLAIFGPTVSAAVADLLAAAGIEFIGSTYADPRHGELRLEPG